MARGLDVTLVVIGLAYPFLVYFGLRILPPGVVATGLFTLLALRFAFGRPQSGLSTLSYLVAGILVLVLAAHSPMVGLKAYPVLMSLGFAGVFGYSLVWPPTVVERIARLSDPDLPLEVNSYLRKVTIAWLLFFLINAAISVATATSGSLRLWTLYNGFISYLAIGAMFAGEFLIRQVVRQRIRSAA